MSEIQHPSLKAELLYLIGRASAPLSRSELYEKCELADEVSQVAKALSNLQFDEKIVRIASGGQSLYKLADGVSTPAPAGKTGRPPIADPDAVQVTVPRPKVEIPTLGAPVGSTGKNPGPKAKNKPVEPGLPVVDIPPPEDVEVAKGLDLLESHIDGAPKNIDDAGLADAIIAKTREQMAPRWMIDQGGTVRLFNASGFGVTLSPMQARVLAEMVLVMHDVLEQHA